MKIVFALLIIFQPSFAKAITCAEYEAPIGVEIIIEKLNKPNVTMFYFKAPVNIDGHKIDTISLWLTPINTKLLGEAVVPMAYEVKSGKVEGNFFIVPGWVKAEIIAKYGNGTCGPSICKNVNISQPINGKPNLHFVSRMGFAHFMRSTTLTVWLPLLER